MKGSLKRPGRFTLSKAVEPTAGSTQQMTRNSLDCNDANFTVQECVTENDSTDTT